MTVIYDILERLEQDLTPEARREAREEIGPTSIIQSPTGALVIGELAYQARNDLERTVMGSLALVRTVAAALPIDSKDERLVDALMTKRLAKLPSRPLRRRDPGER